jgi:hypothetical protein
MRGADVTIGENAEMARPQNLRGKAAFSEAVIVEGVATKCEWPQSREKCSRHDDGKGD